MRCPSKIKKENICDDLVSIEKTLTSHPLDYMLCMHTNRRENWKRKEEKHAKGKDRHTNMYVNDPCTHKPRIIETKREKKSENTEAAGKKETKKNNMKKENRKNDEKKRKKECQVEFGFMFEFLMIMSVLSFS